MENFILEISIGINRGAKKGSYTQVGDDERSRKGANGNGL